MAYDRYTSTHHLTPDGWVHGEARPVGAVETLECEVDQPSGWSDESRDWSCVWASPDIDRATRDQLRARHQQGVFMVPGRHGGVRVEVGQPL
jgi:hypothetical protein